MQISITIDDKMIGQLDVIAREKDRSRSKMIQILIKDYLMKHNYTEGVCISYGCNFVAGAIGNYKYCADCAIVGDEE